MRYEQQKLRRELLHLCCQILECAIGKWQAHDVGRPTHQFAQIVIAGSFDLRAHRLGEAKRGITLRVCLLAYPLRSTSPVEPQATGAAVELRRVGNAKDGLEAHAESADLGGTPLAGHMGEHQAPDAFFVNGLAIIRTIEEALRQPDEDAPPRTFVNQRIRAILDELEQLPMGIAAVGRVVFLVGVLRDKVRLRPIGFQGLSGFVSHELSKGTFGPLPRLRSAGRQLDRPASATKYATLRIRKVVLLLHGLIS